MARRRTAARDLTVTAAIGSEAAKEAKAMPVWGVNGQPPGYTCAGARSGTSRGRAPTWSHRDRWIAERPLCILPVPVRPSSPLH
jgi:hypothetical protein